MPRVFKNLGGRVIGDITVMPQMKTVYVRNRAEKFGKQLKRMWLCKCVCGRTWWVESSLLLKSKSCGCFKKRKPPHLRHGQSRKGNWTVTYRTWVDMMNRCRNRNCDMAHRYVKRGITVCERWKVFENFFVDMGEKPSGQSLERINNNLGYFKENCKWANSHEQARNKSTTKLTFDAAVQVALRKLLGESPKVIAKDFAISRSHVWNIFLGKSWKDALTKAQTLLGSTEAGE